MAHSVRCTYVCEAETTKMMTKIFDSPCKI